MKSATRTEKLRNGKEKKMSTGYLPTERCTIEQAKKNAEIRGINVTKDRNGYYWFDQYGSKAVLCVEEGWVRGGKRCGANDDDTVELILSEVTNCQWVNECDDEFSAYLNWDDNERMESAREVAEDVIETAESEGYELTEREAINDELHYERCERKRIGVGDLLPLAAPVREFELYAPTKPCSVEDALRNAQGAGIFTDFHKSGKIDFSFAPLTDAQGPFAPCPVVTIVVKDGFITDAAVYEFFAQRSHQTLQAITKSDWY